jgi:hypothetical protein
MGFALSVLYFVVNYLTPPILFGPLAEYRVELIIAILIFIMSLHKLAGSIILKTPQSVAVAGLAAAMSLSILFGTHWITGAIKVVPTFLPCAYAYFLVCLHCNSKKKLQVIVFMLLLVCLFVITKGYLDMSRGVSGSSALQPGITEKNNPELFDMEHPYLITEGSASGEVVYRLRGLGIINDPNDFGQLLVCEIPLMFIFWRPGKMFRNIVFVLLPVCALLFGTYLTHSRGALLALMAMMIVAARRRIKTLPALLLAGVLFVAAMSLNFTGGRDISASAGSDRTVLWGSGMQILKSHLLFGVGLNNFADNCDGCGHTAHNSLIVCAAELGLFGLFFWCLFLFSTVRSALTLSSPASVSEAGPVISDKGRLEEKMGKTVLADKEEVNHLGRLLVLSLTGFLVAGWFLSRAYAMTFFLLGGIVEVVYEIALQQNMIVPRLRMARVLRYSGGLEVLLLLLMYILLRSVNLMH